MELKELKSKIYTDERIDELLEYIGCHNIKSEQRGSLYTACLPDGNNNRSVQIKNNQSLTVNIRSRGIEGSDIYGLVSYIIFHCETEEERRKCIPKSKKWICEKLGYSLDSSAEKEDEYGKWLKNVLKEKKVVLPVIYNPVLPEMVLRQYVNYPHIEFINDGIEYCTQQMFEISFDTRTERIIIPIRDRNGDIVGAKGRYVGNDIDTLEKFKYVYVIPCNKSLELFNYFRALPHIMQHKEVIVFESEKSVMKACQMNFPNCVAIGGDSISTEQARLLNDLNVKIILSFDKDKERKFVINQTEILNKNNVFIMFDTDNHLHHKDSSVDKGVDVFIKLYKQNTYKI